MVPVELALQLREAGLRWSPARGDCFVLPHRGMDDDVFVLSDMTIEVHQFPTGSVIGFNGVTEWALDSVDQHDALWLPSESQLRDLLGRMFRRLDADESGFSVWIRTPDGEHRYTGDVPAEAYGRALLDVLRSVTASDADG